MNHALRVLEFDKVLERLMNHCETPLGIEILRELGPAYESIEVWHRLTETSQAHQLLADDPPPPMAGLRDPREPFQLSARGATLGGIEVYACGSSLSTMRQLAVYLRSKTESAPDLARRATGLVEAPKIEEKIFSSVDSAGEVLSSASATLARLRSEKTQAGARIVERIQSHLSGKNRDLLSDPIYTVRDGRYVLPLKAENRGKIKGIVHDTSASGATIFVEPEDVLQLGNALREVQAKERAEVQRILGELSKLIGTVGEAAIVGVIAASEIDAILAKARFAYAERGTMPERCEGHFLSLHKGRHPLLPPESTVPLDVEIGVNANLLITGPNTGGKTVAIKCVGLAVAMAQSGLFPLAISARLGSFAGLWADIGDEQSLKQSLSTFSGHIKNIGEALKRQKPGSLMLFDEIGAGTDPAEGAALAMAILLKLAEQGCVTLASTHYGELKAFAYETDGFTNAAMEFDQKSLRPTYRMVMGAPGSSQALRIAARYGIPEDVVDKAKELVGNTSLNVTSLMEQLERSQKLARNAQGEADSRLDKLRKAEAEAERKLAEASEIRAQVRIRAAETIEEALRQIRLEAAEIFDQLRKEPNSVSTSSARQKLKELDTVGREFADEVGPVKVQNRKKEVLTRGMSVRIDGYPQVGMLLSEPSGKTATVQMGALKMTVPLEQVRSAQEKSTVRPKAKVNLGLARAQSAETEIHLRHMRAEEAERDLDKFIDEAVLAGLPSVRIVHGKGEGVLRKMTHATLKRHPHVKSFRDGDPGEGGYGVTVATMR